MVNWCKLKFSKLYFTGTGPDLSLSTVPIIEMTNTRENGFRTVASLN